MVDENTVQPLFLRVDILRREIETWVNSPGPPAGLPASDGFIASDFYCAPRIRRAARWMVCCAPPLAAACGNGIVPRNHFVAIIG